MHQQAQFITNNAVLAFCLFIGGIQPLKIHNEYDDNILDNLRVPGLETARKMKKLGELKYFYQPSEALGKLIAAFDEQAAAVEADTPLVMPNLSPEDAVRVSCYALKNRGKFMDLSFVPAVMMYRTSKGTLTRTVAQEVDDGNGNKITIKATESHPGFSLVSLNLSEAKRRELKL